MRRIWLVILVAVISLGVGVGLAYGVSRLVRNANDISQKVILQTNPKLNNPAIPNRNPTQQPNNPKTRATPTPQPQQIIPTPLPRQTFPTPATPGNNRNRINPGSQLTMDQAEDAAAKYLGSYPALRVGDVMQFEQSFVVIAVESSSGRPALELRVNPNTGSVSTNIGQLATWNLKYGPRGERGGASLDNQLSMQQALEKAQSAVTAENGKAQVLADGFGFYGYYTFKYTVNNQVVGLVSVNGMSGQTWVQSGLGNLVSERVVF